MAAFPPVLECTCWCVSRRRRRFRLGLVIWRNISFPEPGQFSQPGRQPDSPISGNHSAHRPDSARENRYHDCARADRDSSRPDSHHNRSGPDCYHDRTGSYSHDSRPRSHGIRTAPGRDDHGARPHRDHHRTSCARPYRDGYRPGADDHRHRPRHRGSISTLTVHNIPR